MLRIVTSFGPPVTIATALLFYFGWTLTDQQSRAMGLDESIFAMSTRDYVLRSLGALFVPTIIGGTTVLAWILLHSAVLDQLHRQTVRRWVRRLGSVLAWTAWWMTPLIAALGSSFAPAWRELALPLSFALGLVIAEYGVRLRAAANTRARQGESRQPWIDRARVGLIGLLVTAALFWEVTNFAGVVGRGNAAFVQNSVSSLAAVVVHSRVDLHIFSPLVSTCSQSGKEGDYRFAYGRLRLLQRTGDTYFLVPDGWSPEAGSLLVLPANDDVRLEFTGTGDRGFDAAAGGC